MAKLKMEKWLEMKKGRNEKTQKFNLTLVLESLSIIIYIKL